MSQECAPHHRARATPLHRPLTPGGSQHPAHAAGTMADAGASLRLGWSGQAGCPPGHQSTRAGAGIWGVGQTALSSSRCAATPTGLHDARILLGELQGWRSGVGGPGTLRLGAAPSDPRPPRGQDPGLLPHQRHRPWTSRNTRIGAGGCGPPLLARGVLSSKHSGHFQHSFPDGTQSSCSRETKMARKPPSENTATLGTGSLEPVVDPWWVSTGTCVLRGRRSGDGPSSAHGAGYGQGRPVPAQSCPSLA